MLCHERILRMEEQVGVIADNPHYANMQEMTSTHGPFYHRDELDISTVSQFQKTQNFDKPIQVQD